MTEEVTTNNRIPTAPWLEGRGRSVLREMVGLVSKPGIVSLAGGLPDPSMFPAREYAAAVAMLLEENPRALQYAPVFAGLPDQIVEIMRLRGVECAPEQIFLTTGAQQGIDIATRLLVANGDAVAMESLTYTGIHNTIAPFQPEIQTVETDLESGIDVDGLERCFRARRPSLTYVIPDGHNPLGVSMSPEKRQQLVDLAVEHRVPIVEDDPYGLLWFDREFDRPLRALEDRWVIYLGSFSKILAPALRLGWMVVPEELLSRVTLVKEASDLECSALTQRAVSTILADGILYSQLRRIRASYRARRDAMLDALRDSMPPGVHWTRPGGGMFVWVQLPRHVDAFALLDRSLEEESVAFIPGAAFASNPASGAGSNCARLSFASLQPEQIRFAVEKLAACLKRSL